MHNVFPGNGRNCIQRELNSRLVNTLVSNPLFVYWTWITPQFLKGNKAMCFVFAKAINPQVEATLGWCGDCWRGWVLLLPMPWPSFKKKVSRIVEQTDGYVPGESAFSPCPLSGHWFIPLCQMANVFKLAKVGLHDNRSNSSLWRESWKPFWTLLIGLRMSASLGNLPRLYFAMTGRDRDRSCTDSSPPQSWRLTPLVGNINFWKS